MAAARIQNDELMKEFAEREDEIDKLEDEIIKEYTNPDEIKLADTPDHIQCQVVLAATQRMLSRVTEIYNGSLKNVAKLRGTRQMLLDVILPLMSGGSADAREAKARQCTEGLNYLIALEEGLMTICESTQKNLKSSQEMASRQLKAFELDLTYFNGADTFSRIVENSRKKHNLNG